MPAESLPIHTYKFFKLENNNGGWYRFMHATYANYSSVDVVVNKQLLQTRSLA